MDVTVNAVVGDVTVAGKGGGGAAASYVTGYEGVDPSIDTDDLVVSGVAWSSGELLVAAANVDGVQNDLNTPTDDGTGTWTEIGTIYTSRNETVVWAKVATTTESSRSVTFSYNNTNAIAASIDRFTGFDLTSTATVATDTDGSGTNALIFSGSSTANYLHYMALGSELTNTWSGYTADFTEMTEISTGNVGMTCAYDLTGETTVSETIDPSGSSHTVGIIVSFSNVATGGLEIAIGKDINAAVGDVTVSGKAPTVSITYPDVDVNAVVGDVTASGASPTVGTAVVVTVGDVTVAGDVPSITTGTGVNVTAVVGDVTVAGKGGGGAAASYVTGYEGSDNSQDTDDLLVSGVAWNSGELLVAAANVDGTTGDLNTPTDDGTGTWTEIGEISTDRNETVVWAKVATTNETGRTVTFSYSDTNAIAASIDRFTGFDLTSTATVATDTDGSGTNALIFSGSSTANYLHYMALGSELTNTWSGYTADFTEMTEIANSNSGITCAYDLTGESTVSETIDPSGSSHTVGIIVSFSSVATGGLEVQISEVQNVPPAVTTTAGVAPTLDVPDVNFNATVGYATVSGVAPSSITAGTGASVTAVVGGVTVNGAAPTITAVKNVNVTAAVADITASGVAPTVGTGTSVTIPVADVTVAGVTPTFTITVDLTVPNKVMVDARADFRADFQGTTFPTGWRYMWNETSDIGDSAGYSDLAWNSNQSRWTEDGTDVPTSGDLGWGMVANDRIHSGSVASGSPPRDRGVVVRWSVDQDGTYGIRNSFADQGSDANFNDGVRVSVYVNDVQVGSTITTIQYGFVYFDNNIGTLEVGDTVDVIFDANQNTGWDTTYIDFQVGIVRDVFVQGVAPTFSGDANVTVPVADVTVDGVGPATRVDESVTVPPGDVTVDGVAPIVTVSEIQTVPVADVTVDGVAPSLSVSDTISAAIADIAAGGVVPSVSTGTSVVTTVGDVSVAGNAPSTITSETIAAAVASVTGIGVAPQFVGQSSVNVDVSAVVGDVSVDGAAPSVSVSETITGAVGDVSVDGVAPSVSVSETITGAVGDATVAGVAPSVAASETIAATVGDVTVAGAAPVVNTDINITVTVGDVAGTGVAPAISTGSSIISPASDVSSVGLNPTVSTDVNVTITVADVTVAGVEPAIFTGLTVPATIANVSVDGTGPSVATTVNLTATVGDVNVAGVVPVIRVSETVTAPPGDAVVSGVAPAVSTDVNVTVPVSDVNAFGKPPILQVAGDRNIQIPAVDISTNGLAPSVGTGVSVTAAVGDIAVGGTVPDVVGLVVFVPSADVSVTTEVPVVAVHESLYHFGDTEQFVYVSGVAPSVSTGVTVNATVADVTVSGTIAAISTDVNIDVSVGDVNVSGKAPVVLTDICVAVSNVAVSGLSATVQIDDSVTAAVASVTVSGEIATLVMVSPAPASEIIVAGVAPSIAADANIVASVASVTATGVAPVAQIEDTLTVPIASVTVAGVAPSVVTNETVSVPTATVSVSGREPAKHIIAAVAIAQVLGWVDLPLVVVDTEIVAAVATVTVGAQSPSATATVNVAVSSAAVAANGRPPAIQLEGNINLGVAVGDVSAAGLSPSVSTFANVAVNVIVGEAGVAAVAPAIESITAINASLAGVTVVGKVPLVSGNAIVAAVPGGVIAEGLASSQIVTDAVPIPGVAVNVDGVIPSVFGDANVQVPVGDVTVTALVEEVSATGNVTATIGDVTVSAVSISYAADGNVTVPTATLVISGLTATTIGAANVATVPSVVTVVGLIDHVDPDTRSAIFVAPIGFVTVLGMFAGGAAPGEIVTGRVDEFSNYLSSRHNLTVQRGSTLLHAFTLIRNDGAPLNLTNYDVKMVINFGRAGTKGTETLTYNNGGIRILSNQITIHMNANATSDISDDGHYYIETVSPIGKVERPVSGKFMVSEHASR